MIEFNGYISGVAEKHFYKKNQRFTRNILFTSMLVILPFIIRLSISVNRLVIVPVYVLFMVVFPLLAYIPQGEKQRRTYLPKKIFTERESIISIADAYAESRYIEDAKELRDYGAFYEIVFPFGKISDKFICQKALLTKGTLEEFESLFEGKISRCCKN